MGQYSVLDQRSQFFERTRGRNYVLTEDCHPPPSVAICVGSEPRVLSSSVCIGSGGNFDDWRRQESQEVGRIQIERDGLQSNREQVPSRRDTVLFDQSVHERQIREGSIGLKAHAAAAVSFCYPRSDLASIDGIEERDFWIDKRKRIDFETSQGRTDTDERLLGPVVESDASRVECGW